MKFKDIKFTPTTTPKGVQALLEFGDYELSVICNESSYGGKNNGSLYEIGVFKDAKMINTAPVEWKKHCAMVCLAKNETNCVYTKNDKINIIKLVH